MTGLNVKMLFKGSHARFPV